MESLLDAIKDHMGCWVLSDLHNLYGTSAFKKCIHHIPKGKYPLEEWIECVYYLTGDKKMFRTETEARACLLQKRGGIL